MPKRIAVYDGMRGIAILCVLVAHGMEGFSSQLARLSDYLYLAKFGVSYFFVLSGYLIFSLSRNEIERTGTFSWKHFYLRRVIRIFPCFYFYLLVVAGLTQFGILDLSLSNWFSAATYSISYLHFWSTFSPSYTAVGHYWTLSLEEQFYFIWPLIIVAFRKGNLIPILLGVIIACPFIRFVAYFQLPESRGHLGMMFFTAIDSIATGVLIAALEKHKRIKPVLEWISKTGWSQIALFLFALVGTRVLELIVLKTFGPRGEGGFRLLINPTLLYGSLAFLIGGVRHAKTSLFYKACTNRVIVFFGVLSYSLYVWNNLFLLTGKAWPGIGAFPLNYVCVFSAALFSYFAIERPFLKLKDRFKREAQVQPLPPLKKVA